MATSSTAAPTAVPGHHSPSDRKSAPDQREGEHNHRTLHFDVKFSPFDLIDVDRSGVHDFSNGDEIVFHDRLFSRHRRVGDEAGSCVVVDGRLALANCTGVVRLRGGLIAFQFLNEPPPNKTLVITGGTGRFLNVGGTGTLHEDATGPTGTTTLRLVAEHP
jgi:hypothetical protein